MREPKFTLGIEEEYLLVDLATRELVKEMPSVMLDQCEAFAADQQVKPEFMRSQIEITTPVCRTVGEARIQLGNLRRAAVEESARYGLAPIAASSHPFSLTAKQQRTDKERYVSLLEEMQGAIRRDDGEDILAAVCFADLRDFTGLSDRLPRPTLLKLLKQHFEVTWNLSQNTTVNFDLSEQCICQLSVNLQRLK